MRCFLLLLATCGFLFASAQTHFVPATVVLHDGSVLKGEIDDQGWEASPKRFSFREGGKTRQLDPATARSVSIENGRRFESFVVKMDLRQIEAGKVSHNAADTFYTGPLFLEVLVKGPAYSLYSYRDFKDHFFMRVGEGAPEELIYQARIDRPSNTLGQEYYGVDSVKYHFVFRDQVARFFSGNEAMKKEIFRAKYEREDLKVLFSTFNGTSYKKVSRRIKRFFAGVGAQMSTLSFADLGKGITPDFRSSFQPAFHAGVMISGRRKQKDWSIRVELAYWKSSLHSRYLKETLQVDYDYEYSFEQQNIMLSPTFFYDLVKKEGLSIQAGLGAGFRYLTYGRAEEKYTNKTSSNVYTEDLKMEKLVGSVIPTIHAEIGGHFSASLFTTIMNTPYTSQDLKMRSHVRGIRIYYIF